MIFKGVELDVTPVEFTRDTVIKHKGELCRALCLFVWKPEFPENKEWYFNHTGKELTETYVSVDTMDLKHLVKFNSEELIDCLIHIINNLDKFYEYLSVEVFTKVVKRVNRILSK